MQEGSLTTATSRAVSMIAPLRDGIRAAIMAICQGDEYQFTTLVAFVAFILGEAVCLFDATQGTEITLLDSWPGVVKSLTETRSRKLVVRLLAGLPLSRVVLRLGGNSGFMSCFNSKSCDRISCSLR